jgi:hypothetical protein
MRTLGFNLQKNQLRFVVLEGSKNLPVYVTGQKLINNNATSTPALMNWFNDSFSRLIDEHQADLIGYRLVWSAADMGQVVSLHYPYGVLNAICHDKQIQLIELTSQKLSYPQSFGLAKGIDLTQHCSIVFPTLNPSDKAQKDAALVSWYLLE